MQDRKRHDGHDKFNEMKSIILHIMPLAILHILSLF